MSYAVFVGSFSKRLNSTKRPDYSGWVQYNCTFKEETSIYRPTLRLSASYSAFVGGMYNYAYMLGSYYYIADIRAVRTGYIEIDLILDRLATFKNQITGTSAFIEYGYNTFDAGSRSARFADRRVPVSENPQFTSESLDLSDGLISPRDGCYVLQCVGDNPDPTAPQHGLATFVLRESNLRDLLGALNSDLDDEIQDILSNVNALTPQQLANELSAYSMKQELLNESAMAAIQSIKWLPFTWTQAVGTYTEITLGKFATGVYGTMLAQNTNYVANSDLDIPWPDGVNDWRRHNCQLLLYAPFFGTIPIQCDQIIDTESLLVTWTAEFFSGSISLLIRTPAYVIYAASTNVSVDMGIGRSQVGVSGMVGGSLQALGGALQMAGGVLDIGAGAVGAALGFGSVADKMASIPQGAGNIYQGFSQMIQPVISCAGMMGGMAAIAQTQIAVLTCIYFPPIDLTSFAAKYGHPVFDISTPAAGFCKTRGFSVSISGRAEDAAAINAAMDGGVFIE